MILWGRTDAPRVAKVRPTFQAELSRRLTAMWHHRRFVVLLLSALAVVTFTALSPAHASEPLTLTVGDSNGDHAEIIFSPEKESAQALTIRTVRIGVAGSRLQLSIDSSPLTLISKILSGEDCRFGDAGSMCELTVSGETKLYMDIVYSFQLGLAAHLMVENAGVMAMSDSVSLRGFTAAYSDL
jgi:hypothetical protein